MSTSRTLQLWHATQHPHHILLSRHVNTTSATRITSVTRITFATHITSATRITSATCIASATQDRKAPIGQNQGSRIFNTSYLVNEQS